MTVAVIVGLAMVAWALTDASARAPANDEVSGALAPHCGSLVTKDVTLHADLTGCHGDGLVIAANQVTVDLHGHSIEGSGGDGINNAHGYDRVTVQSRGGRGEISGFIRDVAIFHGDDNVVRNLDADIIDVKHSSGGRLANNRLVRLLHVDHGHQLHIVGNTISGLSDAELDVARSSRILLRGNRVLAAHRQIVLSNTVRSRVLGNEVNMADEPAIWLIRRSDHNVVAGNRVGQGPPGAFGIAVQASNRNRIAHNLILHALEGIVVGYPDGFLARHFGHGVSHGNLVTQNTARRGGIGIRAAEGSAANTLVDRNTAAFGDQGIRAGSPSTALADNVAKENEGHGISAVRGVENLGGNVAIRNRGRPQCVHLRCRTIPPGT
jgi:hypothetical protein